MVILFFLPLFWPVPQIFITPDSSSSDTLYFFYPTKHILSESLKQNRLPLWTDLIGTGFPLIGEGQIQAFSLINLLLFKFLPFVTAFNYQYVLVFLGFSIGMYLIIREFELSKLTAVFCSIIYTYSGLHIVKIVHPTCLQALSYVPFIFLIILRMQKNKKTNAWLLLPFLCSQQILQGHYQYVFMMYIFLALYFYFSWWKNQKKDRIWLIKKTIVIGMLTIGLAAIQLFPSFEYFTKSGQREGLTQQFIGHFSLSHLLLLFFPYILGDNRIGAYPVATYGLGFHETFIYIGLIPIMLALSSLLFVKKNMWIRACWIVIIILFVLVFEKNSPFYLLFTFPPLSWFRVYSRFLAFITFPLIFCAGFIFHHIEQKLGKHHIIVILLFSLSVIDVLSFASSYQPILPASSVNAIPPLLKSMTSKYRIAPIPKSSTSWYNYISVNGWKHPNDYIYLLNNGIPNYASLHNISNFSLYAGYFPTKLKPLLFSIMNTGEFDEKKKVASLSSSMMTTFRLNNAAYLISPFQITNKEVTLIDQIEAKNNAIDPFYLFKLSDIKPKYYLTSRYKPIYFFEEYQKFSEQHNILSQYDALLTTTRTIPTTEMKGKLNINSDDNTQKSFSIQTPNETFFVASLYFYPGWIAYLDGKKTDIIPANLSGLAVYIPEGKHTLILRFIPKSIYAGAVVSSIFILLYILYVIRSVYRTSSGHPGILFPWILNAHGSRRRSHIVDDKGTAPHTD